MIRRAVGLAAAATSLSVLVGCGPAAPSGAAEPVASAPIASAEDACFAVANAARAKKPGEPESITVAHLLVKHTGSKNPPDGLTRTRGQACLRAMEARDRVIAGAPFDAMVGEYSDEPGAASRGGSLGAVRRADVVPAFADAAFELDRGQMSDVVETEFGFHVILRAE